MKKMKSETSMESNGRPLILIVDDLPKNLQIVGNILKKIDCRVAVSTNGKQAIEMMEKMEIDLVLLDIIMPEMNGFEVCKQLKSNPETTDIPIIFLTAARKESKDIVEGFRAGAVDYITKPINQEELLARVNTHLELRRSRQTIIRKNREQKEMLHILCHDLANPFYALESLFELCEKDMGLLFEFFPSLKIMVKNGSATIDQVREMSQLDDFNAKLELESINFSDILSESQVILTNRYKEKQVVLKVDINKDLKVIAERTSLINSVLNNILTNALKFSFPGSNVEVSAEREGDMVSIAFRDYGLGMPASLVEKIFDVGKSTSRTGTAGELGTGYGMRLMHKFVTAYGGRFTVHSKDKDSNPNDHGTEIILHLASG